MSENEYDHVLRPERSTPRSRADGMIAWPLQLAVLAGLASIAYRAVGPGADAGTVAWSAVADGPIKIYQPPYVDGEAAVFTTEDHRVFAFDPDDGRTLWSTFLPSSYVTPFGGMPPGNMVGLDDLILVPAFDLYALDRRTGAVRWLFSPTDEVPATSGLATDGSSVFSAGGTRFLYAVDGRTGVIRWRTDLGERPFSPTYANHRVYVGAMGTIDDAGGLGLGHVWALDAGTGEVIWKTLVGDPLVPVLGGVTARVGLLEDLVVVSGTNGQLLGLDRETGAVRWERKLPNDGFIAGAVMFVDSVAVLGALSGLALGLDPRTGDILWERPTGSSMWAAWHGGGGLALMANGKVVAIDIHGNIALRFPSNAGGSLFVGGVTYYNGRAYAGGSDGGAGRPGGFYALRLQ